MYAGRKGGGSSRDGTRACDSGFISAPTSGYELVTEATSSDTESFYCQMWDYSGSSWTTRVTVDATSDEWNYYTLTANEYSADLDQDIAAALLHTYSTKLNPAHRAPYVAEQLDYAGGNHTALAQTLYQQSFLTKAATAIQLAEQDPVAFIRQAEGDFAGVNPGMSLLLLLE